ncbi:hypothetical protein SAMN02745219_00301 [Desulfofundulus thermosubterraneus DSM 16057]|uniref:Uncharacterized protein n=2 Tax=Desulfofundulus TaxID=2282741 RepID=A0A1M6B4I8_9FIRM|nr:hypothetical protein SAMN02745219_00301 [Desulfofundulus thermosubterraneus DSM 16057]
MAAVLHEATQLPSAPKCSIRKGNLLKWQKDDSKVQMPCRLCSAASPVRSEYGSGIDLFQVMQTFSDAAAARIISFCDKNHFVSAEHRSERGQRGTIAGLLNIYQGRARANGRQVLFFRTVVVC